MASIELKSDGQGFMGTFGNTVRYILSDLLEDGPVPNACIRTDGGWIRDVTVRAVAEDFIVLTDDREVHFDEVLTLIVD